MSKTQKVAESGRRAIANYRGLGRHKIQSRYRAFADNLPADVSLPAGNDYPPLDHFDKKEFWYWATTWLKAIFQTIFVPGNQKYPFQNYTNPTGEHGVYDLDSLKLLAKDNSIRIALAGDWGTGTDIAFKVTNAMVAIDPKPELTIHLGDVYYMGFCTEVKENCLNQNVNNYNGVEWQHGTKGSFALNGNHEMYSGGKGYFQGFLPTLGIPESIDRQQLTSYFCLETPVWRILAIDTGYNSDRLFNKCELEQTLLDWLKKFVDPVHKRKPTVLLSHHQWFSGFDDGNFNLPATQIKEYFQGQDFVWLWGHEHRLAIYNKYTDSGTQLKVYARCIGHGGMPIEMPPKGYPKAGAAQQVEFWDGDPKRTYSLPDGTVVGINGYIQMVIKDSVLTLEYLTLNCANAGGTTSVFKESFEPTNSAPWDGTLVRKVTSNPALTPFTS